MGFSGGNYGAAENARRGASYTGQVATRGLIPNLVNTSFQQANGQSLHIARDRITSLQVAFANWYSDSGVHEAGSGGTATYTAAISYPIGSGVWQQFKWSTVANSGAVANGSTSPLSDSLTLSTPIPAGAGFLIRQNIAASVGVCVRFYAGSSVATYDLCEFAASGLADKTTNNASIAANTGSILAPCLIVAKTRRPSIFAFGDSRIFGFGDSPTGGGDAGEICRSMGQNFGYVNVGTPSETAQGFLLGNAKRLALAAYCSHVCCNYGINDITAGRTAVQILADIASIVALFGTKPAFWNTITPRSTSTDAWATIANQTADANNAIRVAVNNALLAGAVAGLAGVFDLVNAVESATGSGKFAIGNGGQAITGDGLHLNSTGYMALFNSSNIALRKITRELST